MLGPILLLLTTLIWGSAFLAQKVGADALSPLAITIFRNVLGGMFLTLCIFMRPKRVTRTEPPTLGPGIKAGVLCGIPLFAAMMAQQIGIGTIPPGVSAFLTTNYVLFTPLLSALILMRKPPRGTWPAVLLALAGTYLICVQGQAITLGKGELWTILCALLFAIQILVIDRFARACDVLVLSASQLFTCVILGLPFLLLPSERALLSWPALKAGWWSVFYCGVFSSGIAYTLQNFGQARTPAVVSALILSLESVFGALFGWLLHGDALTHGQLIGCALVFIGANLQVLKQVVFRVRPHSSPR